MRLLNFFLVFALVTLTACSSLAPKNAKIWSGRFSITIQDKDGADRHSGSFQLTALPIGATLIIRGPLGARIATVEEKEGRCELLRPNEKTLISDSSSQLMMQVLGIPLGIEDLVKWLSGSELSSKETGIWKLNLEESSGETPKRISAEGILPVNESKIRLIILPKREQ